MREAVAEVATAAAIGCRERQEDAVAARFSGGAESGFAVLSDGMGGHDDGDLAARVIVSEISDAFGPLERLGPLDQAQWRERLLDGVRAANRGLRSKVEDGSGQEGMGGTVVAAVVQDDTLRWVSVGDSSLYLFRDGRLARLNEDHSLAPQIDLLAKRGMMDAETARTHPQRGCLTSALVGAQINKLDCPDEPVTLAEGDILLMASDGLCALDWTQVEAILAGHRDASCDRIARALIQAVTEVDDPDQDNVAVIVIKPRVPGLSFGADMPCAAARAPILSRIRTGMAQLRALFAAAAMDRIVR